MYRQTGIPEQRQYQVPQRTVGMLAAINITVDFGDLSHAALASYRFRERIAVHDMQPIERIICYILESYESGVLPVPDIRNGEHEQMFSCPKGRRAVLLLPPLRGISLPYRVAAVPYMSIGTQPNMKICSCWRSWELRLHVTFDTCNITSGAGKLAVQS